MAVGVDVGPNDEVTGVRTFFGITFRARAVVLTTGTFMNGTIWVGKQSMSAGRWAGFIVHTNDRNVQVCNRASSYESGMPCDRVLSSASTVRN